MDIETIKENIKEYIEERPRLELTDGEIISENDILYYWKIEISKKNVLENRK